MGQTNHYHQYFLDHLLELTKTNAELPDSSFFSELYSSYTSLYKKAEELSQELLRLQIDKSRYEIYFNQAPIAFLCLDANYKVIYHNLELTNLLNIDIENGRPLSEIKVLASQSQLFHSFSSLINDGEIISNELLLDLPSGKKHIKISSKCCKVNHELQIECALIDMTFECAYRNKIEYLVYHDSLTGIMNRRFFTKMVSAYNYDTKILPLGILIMDVNGLKVINDAFGHFHGDQLLTRTANLLTEVFSDQTKVIARTGGDEFSIMLPNTNLDKIKSLLEKVHHLCSSIEIDNIKLSLACGYNLYEDVKTSIFDAIQSAEIMMYSEKLFQHTQKRKRLIDSLLQNLHMKHPDEKKHSYHVEYLAQKMGNILGFDKHQLYILKTAALLHDLGKIALNYKVLDNQRILTKEEFEQVKRHPEIGYRILTNSNAFNDVADIVLTHHERVDGTGYPLALKGDEIRIEAKIISICDAFSAMIIDSSFHQAFDIEKAKEELLLYRNSQFDGALVDIFIQQVLNTNPNLLESMENYVLTWDEH